jgi:hypothetical protein
MIIALYVSVLWGPGLAWGWLAGLRSWTLVAAAPLLGYTLTGLAGPTFAAAGIRWSPVSAGLLLLAVLLALAAVRWAARRPMPPGSRLGRLRAATGAVSRRLTGRRPVEPESAAGWARAEHLGVAAAVVALAGYGTDVIGSGIGRLSAVPQDWDAVFHANGIRYIADTGDSSLVGMGTVNWFENGVQVFYPNAYHLVGALVLRLSGADVPSVLNAHALLLPGMCALAVVALVHRFGGGAVLAVTAAACSVGVTSFYDMLWRGPLLPFATGVALLPLTAVLLADLLDATGWRATIRGGLLFAATLVGLISLNPAVLFSAVLFTLPMLVQRWIGRPGRLRPELITVLGAGLAAGVLVLPQILGSLASAGGEPVDWLADLSWRRAAFELVTLSHDSGLSTRPHPPTHPEWAISAAVLVGVLRIRTLGRLRWVLASGLVFAVLFLLTASSDAAWVNALTRPWWNDRWRFIGLCVVPIGVLGGHGLTELYRGLARWAGGRLDPRLRPAALAGVLVAALFLTLSAGLYAGQNTDRMRLYAPNGPVVSDDEVAAMKVLATLVPPGERVLNDRGDGSAWMYAIAGVLPVAGHYNTSRIGPDAYMLAGNFRDYATDPIVREAVARLGVHYVMLGRGFVREPFRRQYGFRGLDQMRWLQLVYRNPDAVIYRILPAGPDRP